MSNSFEYFFKFIIRRFFEFCQYDLKNLLYNYKIFF